MGTQATSDFRRYRDGGRLGLLIDTRLNVSAQQHWFIKAPIPIDVVAEFCLPFY
jgi:hypothetical protein